jgi:long-chain fatty acid transport protein
MKEISDGHYNKLKEHVKLGCLAVALSSAAGKADGAAFDLPVQDAFATARGEAFVATADNPSAIYYNPAGITQLQGNNFRAGIYGIDVNLSYKSPAGTTYNNQDPLHAVPQFFYTYSLEDLPVSFGLGVYSPYGLSNEWPQDTGFRTIGTQASITYATINPVIAWQIIPSLSVAAGLTVNYANLNLQQGLFWPAQPYDEFKFEGNGWAVGYNLGALWKPIEKISFGASFRSPTSLNLNGSTTAYNNVTTPSPPFPYTIPPFSQGSSANAKFPFPLNTIVGISYRPTPKWNIEFDAEYTDWNTVNTITVNQSTPAPILPASVPLTLDWQSNWYYESGVTRYFDNGWHVSGGYLFEGNAVPEQHYQPLIADQNRNFFSIGTGYKGKRFDFDIAYEFGFGPTRTISGSEPSATGQTADGQYTFISNAVAVSVGWHF